MFYHKYIDLCNKRGISPSAAAEKIGFYRSDVTRWGKGSTPRQASLQKIADYFGVPVSYLTGEEQKEKPPAKGGEPMDQVTRELMEFVETASEDERRAILEVAHILKKQRRG